MPEPGEHSGIVVVGSINLDVVAELDHLPAAGETIIARAVRRNVGGKGANQAVAASRAGGRVEFIGRTGDDAPATAFRDALRAAGVGIDGLRSVAGAASGTAYISVAGNDNVIVVDAGANWVWPTTPVPDDVRMLRAAALVVGQLEVPDEVLSWVVRTTDCRLVLNAAPARALPAEVLDRCDPLVVNQQELALISGTPVTDVESAQAAQQRVIAAGAISVVTTLGPQGAVFAAGKQIGGCRAPSVTARDTTGAGDAFVGILATDLARGVPLPDAVSRAVAGASLSVQRDGTHASYPDRPAIDAAADALAATQES